MILHPYELLNIPWKTIIVVVLSVFHSAHANVQSTNGTINFSPMDDQSVQMKLNGTGLGIGTSPSANLQVSGNAIINEQLSLGALGSSNLNIAGSIGISSQNISSNIVLDQHSLYLVDSSGGNLFLDLPYASNVTGRQVSVKKTSLLHSVYVRGGGNTIDQSEWIVLSSGNHGFAEFLSDGSNWYELSTYPSSTAQSNIDIFFETFSGSGNLSGSAESVSGNSWVTLSSNISAWSANGMTSGADSEFMFLPYIVNSGRYLTLSMDIIGSGFSSNWIGLGFARAYNSSTPRNNLSDMGPWMMLRNDKSLTHKLFGGFGTSGSSYSYSTSNTANTNLKLAIDTRLSTTYVSWYVDDVKVKGPEAHTLSDSLTYLGFGKNGAISANVDNFRLQEWY